MRNYLKFIIVVAGFTVATFSTIKTHAKEASIDGCSCDKSASVCGKTENGELITGKYS